METIEQQELELYNEVKSALRKYQMFYRENGSLEDFNLIQGVYNDFIYKANLISIN